jgi:hypothetical protein
MGEYDFTDSIVIGINWDSNLLDLLVKIDYYWSTQGNNSELIIRFKNCRETVITMPKAYNSVSKNELQSYVYSWHTITNCMVAEVDDLLKVNIKTIDDNPKWLTVTCEDIWLEDAGTIHSP